MTVTPQTQAGATARYGAVPATRTADRGKYRIKGRVLSAAADRESMRWPPSGLQACRRWWPDRNPPRRTADRVEAAMMAVLLVAFLVGVPLAALAPVALPAVSWWPCREAPAPAGG